MIKIEKPELYSYLDISTCHITMSDGALLEKHGEETVHPTKSLTGPIVYDYPQGAFVSVSADEESYEDYSPEFRAIIEFARSKGCLFVHFDGDGAEYDGIPRFEW